MTPRALAWWATGSATAALAGMALFWLAIGLFLLVEQPSSLSDAGTILIWTSALGTVINLAVIAMLGGPALVESWRRHQLPLAIVSVVGLASLFVLYGPFMLNTGSYALEYGLTTLFDLALIATAALTFLAVPVSLGFTVATIAATRRRLPSTPQIRAT